MNNNRFKLLEILNDNDKDYDNHQNITNDNIAIYDINDSDDTIDDVYKIKNKFKKINYKFKYKKPENNYNHKKILCQNNLMNGVCTYNDRCQYAHSLTEQKIDIRRKKILDLIDSENITENIDIQTYKDLNLFTVLCNDCINKKCSGGYNCKLGAPLEKYLVCYDDLNYGHCTNDKCIKNHLTKKGLKPQYNLNNQSKPHISNIKMLIPFINNLDILTINQNNINGNDMNDINCINENITINDTNMLDTNINDNENNIDNECIESIFIDKYKYIDIIN